MRPRPSFVSQSRPEPPDIRTGPALPSSAPDGKQLVRECDARGDAIDGGGGERVVERFGERLRRRRRTAASARGNGDDGGRDREGDDEGEKSEQTGGGERAQVSHVDPSSESSSSGVAPELEISLRAGSSIVKQAPSTNALPPWRSAVAWTIASPRPEPDRS